MASQSNSQVRLFSSRSFASTRAVVFAAATAALVGCHAVGPDYHRPATTMPDTYGQATPESRTMGPPSPADRQPVPLGRWWTAFNDSTLNSLVDRAVRTNLDLKLANERIIQARANRRIQEAGLFPTVDADGSYTRARPSKNGSSVSSASGIGTSSGTGTGTGTTGTGTTGTGTTGTGTTGTGTGTTGSGTGSTGSTSGTIAAGRRSESDLFQTGFDATWEIDVFGGVRRAIEAADADTQAAVEDRRDTLVTLLGDVAQNYISLRGAQRELQITQSNLKSQQDTLELTRTRFKAGLTSDLDVAQSEAQVASTASNIPGIQTTIQSSTHALSVLLAEDPNALRTELTPPSPIPTAPPNVPLGMPSELLRRRPDVRRSERQLAAATANIGVATADLFPRFSLNGETGLQSLKLTNLPNTGSVFYSVGPSMSWAVFDAGKIRANIDVQSSLQRQALATYQKAVLTALTDVDNALVSYDREQARRVSLSQAVDANQRAVNLSLQLYTRGLLDFLSVLDAQRSLFAAQDALVQSDQAVSTDLVALYKALGGGWEAGA